MRLFVKSRRNFRRWTQSSIASLLCCAILLGTVGFPTLRPVVKDRSSPFPCQDKPCGCASADSCWKSCCCHTNQEKVAWAEEHHVVVPDFVIAAAALENPKPIAKPKATGSCCQALAKSGSTCSAVATCHDTSTTKRSATKSIHKSKAQRGDFQLVLTDSYRKCQGHPPLWTALSQAVLPEPHVPLVGPPVAGSWLGTTSESICGLSAPPRLRPPRA